MILGISIIGGRATRIGSTASEMGIDISSPVGRRGTPCTPSSTGSVRWWNDLFNRPRDSSLNSFRRPETTVDASVGHTSAVTNGDVGSLSQTGTVIYSDTDSALGACFGFDRDTETLFVASDSEEHTTAVIHPHCSHSPLAHNHHPQQSMKVVE
jgi:hypothetical protein